jgi:hypothetical protein
VISVIGIDPLETGRVAIVEVERRLAAVQPVEVGDEALDAGVALVLGEVPVDAGVVEPFVAFGGRVRVSSSQTEEPDGEPHPLPGHRDQAASVFRYDWRGAPIQPVVDAEFDTLNPVLDADVVGDLVVNIKEARTLAA